MTDKLSPERRSANMSAVKGRDTGPEMIVRRLAHRLGYRFRLHRKDLPGRPDLTFPRHRAVIFVHGCFWHGHDCKRGSVRPQANGAFWAAKLDRNKTRDAENIENLERGGWRTLVLWECELKFEPNLIAKIRSLLAA